MKNIFPLCSALFALTLLVGCSVGDFIGAYFNTYYNAQRLFGEAETEVLAAGAARPTEDEFLPLFSVPQSARAKFTSVIEKCSKLLQYHPESNFVDDALMLIGKSFYYQNEHQKAERKFKEMIEGYPGSEHVLTAKLLLANTYYMMNDKAAAAKTARELIEHAANEKEGDHIAKGSLILAYIDLEKKDYAAARQHFSKASETAKADSLKSRAFRSVAQMFVHEGNHQRAAESFTRAEATSEDYRGRYRALIGLARTLAKLGKEGQSLELLEELLSNRNNSEFFGEIELEIGNVYRDMLDYEAAIDQYRHVDTAYARTEVAARSYYELGLIYESKLNQYDSARVAYNKGRTEFPQAEVTLSLNRRGDYLNRYFSYHTEIAKYDSLKHVLIAPPEERESPDGQMSSNSDGPEQTDNRDTVRRPPSSPPAISLDTIEVRLAHTKTELAGLFYVGMEVPDSAVYWYRQVLEQHPNSVYASRALFTLTQIYEQNPAMWGGDLDSLRKEILLRFPDSEFAAETKRMLGLPQEKKTKDEAGASYLRAEKLIRVDGGRAAIDTLRSIVKRFPSSPYASKAQYAIAWVYELVRQEIDSAIANYQRLVNLYPGSQYATAVRPMLAEVEAHRKRNEKPAPTDTMATKALPPQPQPDEIITSQKPITPRPKGEEATPPPHVATPRTDEEVPKPR